MSEAAIAPRWSIHRRIAVATLVAGTLDITSAAIIATIHGRSPLAMLRAVASGPFPPAREWGLAGALLGLVVHFVIMNIMVDVFMLASDRQPALVRQPLLAGFAYGLLLWGVMSLIVLPLRWPATQPMLDPVTVLTQLFCHIVLVGIPIALIARR